MPNKTCMISISSNDEYLRWNQTFINESAKMIRLVLVLLIIWTFITIGWTVHLILEAASKKQDGRIVEYSGRYDRYKRSEGSDGWKYEELAFYTSVEVVDWNRIKTFVGSFHQLRESQGKVPELIIYTSKPLEPLQAEESSSWNKVQIIAHNVSNIHTRIWIADGYVFDPVALDLRRAELLSEAEPFKFAFTKGRRMIESLADECVDLVDKETGHVVFKTNCVIKEERFAHEFGLMKIEDVSTKGLSCHVDLKRDSIENGAELIDGVEDFGELEQIGRVNTEKKLVIGVPTTSKGMKSFEEKHVLLTALIPSLNATISATDLKEFKIVIMIGFDHGDLYFEDAKRRGDLKKMIKQVLSAEISVMFLRLKPLRRVAMTWNMIFSLARKHVRFDYFYQVNDDLTMQTGGWLNKFSAKLDENGGIGVAGPSDSFNGFACSLLTQSFVTNKHFEIFSGLMYPLAFRDWKSDRWLSFVYGRERTFCWEEVKGANGAKGTRYEACPFGQWKIELELGQEIIKRY